MPSPLYTISAIKTVANPTVATSIIPAGNAGDSLQIAAGATNAIRYWLHFSGVIHTAGGPGDFTVTMKIGAVTVGNVQNAPFDGSAENGIQGDWYFTVLPNSTVLRRASIIIDGDLADTITAYTTDEPKTASAAITANPITLTITINTGGDASLVVTLQDFQLQQMNA